MNFPGYSVLVLAHRAMAQDLRIVEKSGIELENTRLHEDSECNREQRLLAVCMGSRERLARSSYLFRIPDELIQYISCGFGPV